MGFDIVHINPQRVPCAARRRWPWGGPIAVRDRLEPFCRCGCRPRRKLLLPRLRPPEVDRKVRAFTGPFGVFVRSYAFILARGRELRTMSEDSVLNANYLLARLKDAYDLPFDRLCMHEFVLSARKLKKEHGITAPRCRQAPDGLRLPPPTIYFPLIVSEALMVEPTETETKETLDAFADAMLAIAREAAEELDEIKLRRTDGLSAASMVGREEGRRPYRFEDHLTSRASRRRPPRSKHRASVNAPKVQTSAR